MRTIKKLNTIKREGSKTAIYLFFALLFWVNLYNYVIPTIPNIFDDPTIRSTIDENTADTSINELSIAAFFNMWDKEIHLKINSFGGSVLAGHRIIVKMQQLQEDGYTIICTAERAMSMGFAILQYCDVRKAHSMSLIMQHMIHNGKGRENMSFNSREQYTTIKFLDGLHGRDEAKRLGISFVEYMSRYRYSKWYKGAEACYDNVIDVYHDMKLKKDVPCSELIVKEYAKMKAKDEQNISKP